MTSLAPVVLTAVALVHRCAARRTPTAVGAETTAQTVLVVQHGDSRTGGRTRGAATAACRRTP